MNRFSCRALLSALALAALVSGCASSPARSVGLDPAPYVAKRDFPSGIAQTVQTAEDLLQEINRARIRLGAAPLRADAQLSAIAARHNEFMARQGRLSHDGFDDRFALSGANRCVENVAWNYPTAEAVVRGWLDSPGHRTNLLDPEITHAGVAMDQPFATLFACRRKISNQ